MSNGLHVYYPVKSLRNLSEFQCVHTTRVKKYTKCSAAIDFQGQGLPDSDEALCSDWLEGISPLMKAV